MDQAIHVVIHFQTNYRVFELTRRFGWSVQAANA